MGPYLSEYKRGNLDLNIHMEVDFKQKILKKKGEMYVKYYFFNIDFRIQIEHI